MHENIMRALTLYGPISCFSLAQKAGVSTQIISDNMRVLIDKGWVYTQKQTEGDTGKEIDLYKINPDCAAILVVDLGGTKLRVGITNLAGEALTEQTEPTNPKGGKEVVEQIGAIANHLFTQTPNITVKLAVIGVPGVPVPSAGRVRMVPNIEGLDKINLVDELKKLLGCPVILENDVNLAAMGEYWLRKRNNEKHICDNFVFIAIGTGIGAGVIIDGRLVRGANGEAGEIGYLPVRVKNSQKGALQERIGLEGMIGSAALRKFYHSHAGKESGVKEIFDQAEKGDSIAIKTIDHAADYLTHTIFIMNTIINPHHIILGGAISTNPLFLKKLRQKVSQLPRSPQISVSDKGVRAGLAGGVAIASEQHHVNLFS